VTGDGFDAEELGRELAQQAVSKGASEILSLIPIH